MLTKLRTAIASLEQGLEISDEDTVANDWSDCFQVFLCWNWRYLLASSGNNNIFDSSSDL